MLMRFHFSIFLLVKCSEFLVMVLDMDRCLKEVITQMRVFRLGYRCIIGTVIAGLIFTPDKAGVFRQRLLRFERIDPTISERISAAMTGSMPGMESEHW